MLKGMGVFDGRLGTVFDGGGPGRRRGGRGGRPADFDLTERFGLAAHQLLHAHQFQQGQERADDFRPAPAPRNNSENFNAVLRRLSRIRFSILSLTVHLSSKFLASPRAADAA